LLLLIGNAGAAFALGADVGRNTAEEALHAGLAGVTEMLVNVEDVFDGAQ
jgi:hypothetical protein